MQQQPQENALAFYSNQILFVCITDWLQNDLSWYGQMKATFLLLQLRKMISFQPLEKL